MGEPTITFNPEYSFEYAKCEEIAPAIRRVVANNPSAFTFHGTGTFIVGEDEVVIIDPGPDQDTHINAVLDAVAGCKVSHLLITHTHLDHSPAAAAVQRATHAPTVGFGPHGSGMRDTTVVIEEGADFDFAPDIVVRDGDVIRNSESRFECVYTPGHTSNHMCFAHHEQNALFSGDHVMGWNTTIVSPPDGDMSDYINSLDKLLLRDDAIYYPTHGSPITDPQRYVRDLREHRLARGEQIEACLARHPMTVMELVEQLYQHLPRSMNGAAARSVLATLLYLQSQSRVKSLGDDIEIAQWQSKQNN
ncbi:MAG: MBL fold metallo-hydrolase [Pseudomonadota bacterium]